MKKFNNATDLMNYLNSPDLNLSMHNSSIELDDSSIIVLQKNITLANTNITIHKNATLYINSFCEIRGRIIVQPGAAVYIGKNLICNGNIFIHSAEKGKIIIGDDCLFSNPQIYNSDFHGYYDNLTGKRMNLPKDVEIGNKVWIGLNCLILKGTKIADNNIIGAGSITSKVFDVPNAIVSGNPARIVRENINWTRKIYDQKPSIQYLDTNYTDDFIKESKNLNHNKVISMGIAYYQEWEFMDNKNYYFFYYLCRSLLLKYFEQLENKGFIKVDSQIIMLSELFNIFMLAYNKSNKSNYACGAFAYKTALMLSKNELANQIYNEIYPKWHHISDYNYKKK